MENKLAKWICRRLREKQVIDEEYEEVYVYGLEIIFSCLISTSIILIIGILIKQIIPTLVFLFTFILIRQYEAESTPISLETSSCETNLRPSK